MGVLGGLRGPRLTMRLAGLVVALLVLWVDRSGAIRRLPRDRELRAPKPESRSLAEVGDEAWRRALAVDPT
jgi:hypothetical protein